MQSSARWVILSLDIKQKTDVELRMVWGEVYAPNRPDSDGDFMSAESIRQMAFDFALKNKFDQIDVQHDNITTPGVQVIESFISRKNDPDFIEGAWVIGVYVPDNDLWNKIKNGELNGFSLQALVHSMDDREVEIELPPVITGTTSENQSHKHSFFVTYDEEGNFRGGITSKEDGHTHKIMRGTITEDFNGHTHRFSAVDNLEIVNP